MDDHTIHVNVSIKDINGRQVSMMKERIWRPLVSYLTWTTKNAAMPGFLFDGLGLTFITTTAIIIEGIVADIIDEYKTNTDESAYWGQTLQHATWHNKKEIYNSIFDKKLYTYTSYDAIEIIFLFRNNVGHGLAHIEEATIGKGLTEEYPIKSTNSNYEKIRSFLIQRRHLKPTGIYSNANHLWKFDNACYLWFEARCFIRELLKQNESKFNTSIISEWETATSGRG